MMGWYNDSSIGWGGWIVMTLMMVALWALVIVAVVAILRSSARGSDGRGHIDHGGQRDPMQTLEERFARGEIDVDEYHARRAVLRDTVR